MLYVFLLLSYALTGSSHPLVGHSETPLMALTAESQPGLRVVSKNTVNSQTAAEIPSGPLEMN